MGGEVLDQFPTTIQAGFTFDLAFEAPDHPAPDWSLTAILRGPAAIDLEAAVVGFVHTFTATAETSSAWAGGRYAVSIRASDGVSVVELEAGDLHITPDLAAIEAAHDPRGHAQRVLDAIEAVIENRASKDQQMYSIGGRSLQRTPIADLIALRDKYRREVARARPGRSRLLGRTIKTRFS